MVSSRTMRLGPLLTEEAQVVFQALTQEEARDYDMVRKATLSSLEISKEWYHQKFWSRKAKIELYPRQLAQYLKNLVYK